MANIKSILDRMRDSATTYSYSYLLGTTVSEVNKYAGKQFPCIMVVPPETVSQPETMATHSFTVFVMDQLIKSEQDELPNTNDRYHAQYKRLDDIFYKWFDTVRTEGDDPILADYESDIEIARLRDDRTQAEVIASQYTFDLRATWYCGDITLNPSVDCDPVTVLQPDLTTKATVPAGGTLTLDGFDLTGQTASSGTFNDGGSYEVSGTLITGFSPSFGQTLLDGSVFEVSGVQVVGNSPATGRYFDGSSAFVSGVLVTGGFTATGFGLYQDGATATIIASSGGSTGVTITGETPRSGEVVTGGFFEVSGVQIDGNTPRVGEIIQDGGEFEVSGVLITGNTPATGTQNDNSTFTVSGFSLTGQTASSGTFEDGSSYEVSGVLISGNTPATGTQLDGSTFTVSGVTVTDFGVVTNYNDGSAFEVYRNKRSLSLNGTTQYATTPNTYNLLGTQNDWSFTGWVRIDSFSGGVTHFETGNSATQYMRIAGLGSGLTLIQIRQDATPKQISISYPTLGTGNWKFIAVVKTTGQAASTVTTYIDGVAQTNTVLADTIDADFTYTGTIYHGHSNVLGNYLDGNIDEYRIYNVALSSGDVVSIYNNGCPKGFEGDEVGAWSYDDNTNDDIGSNNATLFNAPNYDTDRP